MVSVNHQCRYQQIIDDSKQTVILIIITIIILKFIKGYIDNFGKPECLRVFCLKESINDKMEKFYLIVRQVDDG